MMNELHIKRANLVNAHKKICEALGELDRATDANELFSLKMKLQQIERELFLYEPKL